MSPRPYQIRGIYADDRTILLDTFALDTDARDTADAIAADLGRQGSPLVAVEVWAPRDENAAEVIHRVTVGGAR